MQINLKPDLSLLAIVVIFFLNYLVVRRFFFKPLTEIIEARETEVTTAERLYNESMARLNEATTKMEAQLHAAKRDAAQVRERFRGEAAAVRTQVVEKTQGEAKKIVAEADARLSSDVKEAREKIGRESESLARVAVERILGRAV
ncbi:MAG: ATP synthase F0 subunit B [Thermoanaerobaculia bacterium]|nr:ATP synthase F0 subunit B [Thermoanaerobaculia bacterium]